MTTTRTAVQLYTLHDMNEPLPDVIRRVAAAGFDGVEFAKRLRNSDPDAVRDALEETELEAVSGHVPLAELEEDLDETVALYETVGCDRLVVPHVSPDHFRTRSRVEALASRLHELADDLDEHGFDLLYHNSREPFLPLLDSVGIAPLLRIDAIPRGGWNHIADGFGRLLRFDESDIRDRTGFGHLVAVTDPDRLEFELDVKWVAAAGYDPRAVFELLGDRLSMVHVTDIAETRRFPPGFESVAPGDGMVDIDGVIETAIEANVPWLVFEHDRPSNPHRALYRGSKALEPHVRARAKSR